MTHIGPYEINSIVTGDARLLAESVPDESIDLIFCDPDYNKLDDYKWLGELAMRVLKPNSACLAWASDEGNVSENGIKKALHICRGHFRTYDETRKLFGKYTGTIWVPSHVRGSAEKGEIRKWYAVK